ncbi:MAG: TldD/PmbA family protein [Bacilli bacterium]|nr:TldD/PmbA family protein [Bacilli bacterium]
MNFKKFFELAKLNGLEAADIEEVREKSLQISLFKGELISYSVSIDKSFTARGIYNGKMGFVAVEKDDAATLEYIVKTIKEAATISENNDEAIIFKGSPKYKKKNLYNEELNKIEAETFIAKLHEIEDKLYAKSDKIKDVEVSFSLSDTSSVLANSYGLNLKTKNNYFYVVAEIVLSEKENETKTAYDIFFDNDFAKFDVDKYVDELVAKGLAKLGGETIKGGKHKVVLKENCVANFLSFAISNANSESVQKHSSVFEGKLNQKICSSKITVEERPLEKNLFYTYFDDEGVATKNKKVIDKGVLKTFFYNLATAKKDGVETTGNARGRGSKMGIGFTNIYLKPGKLSEEELFQKVENGVYVTSLAGLHSGLNPVSGDFSLQAEGFHIKNGKLDKALTLFTLSGNLFQVFNDVIAVGNNLKLLPSSVTVPSMAVKNLKISAE